MVGLELELCSENIESNCRHNLSEYYINNSSSEKLRQSRYRESSSLARGARFNNDKQYYLSFHFRCIYDIYFFYLSESQIVPETEGTSSFLAACFNVFLLERDCLRCQSRTLTETKLDFEEREMKLTKHWLLSKE